MLLQGLYKQLIAQSAITALLNSPTSSVFINVAMKGAPPAFLVLNLTAAPPAGSTFSGVSTLIDGEIQIDSYAADQVSARLLANTVRAYLMQSFVGGTLPDGTTIQFVDVTLDQDDPYEIGGQGYIYRCVQRYQAFYDESGGFTPIGGGVLQSVEVALTAAQIAALAAADPGTPVTLVPAPGAGMAILPISVYIEYVPGSVGFSSSGSVSILVGTGPPDDTDGEGIFETDGDSIFGLATPTDGTKIVAMQNNGITVNLSEIENQPLTIIGSSNVWSQDGNGTAKVFVTYYTVSVP